VLGYKGRRDVAGRGVDFDFHTQVLPHWRRPVCRFNVVAAQAASGSSVVKILCVFCVLSRPTESASSAVQCLFQLIRFPEGFNRRRGEPTEAPRSRR
jgi:hypothetical protein